MLVIIIGADSQNIFCENDSFEPGNAQDKIKDFMKYQIVQWSTGMEDYVVIDSCFTVMSFDILVACWFGNIVGESPKWSYVMLKKIS